MERIVVVDNTDYLLTSAQGTLTTTFRYLRIFFSTRAEAIAAHFRHRTTVTEMAVKLRQMVAVLAIAAATQRFVALANAAPGAGVAPAFDEMIPNVPGKRIIAVLVKYPPGGKMPPHHHARSAYATCYVLSGVIRNQLHGGPVQVFKAGESWAEAPGVHHIMNENVSNAEPAQMLKIFVVDANDTDLTTVDEQ
jgi:quercetin dioxygenase-like cupin family protein